MSFPRYQLSGAAKAPGGSSLQEAASAKLDDLFAEYMQLYAAVREARAQSNAQLKDGFFALAQARHHSTAGVAIALDASAYSGREMLASQGWSIRSLHPSDPSSDDLNITSPKSVEEPLVFEAVTIEYKQGEEKNEQQEEAEPTGADAALRKRGAGAKGDAATKESAAASSSSRADDAPAAPAPASVDLRSAPLSWFGVLAPPQLPAVSASFQSALVSLASVASLAQRLTELEKKFRYLSHLQQATHVDPAAEEELASILEKIKISDAKKAAAAAAAANKKETDATASSADAAAPATQ